MPFEASQRLHGILLTPATLNPVREKRREEPAAIVPGLVGVGGTIVLILGEGVVEIVVEGDGGEAVEREGGTEREFQAGDFPADADKLASNEAAFLRFTSAFLQIFPGRRL